MLLTYAFRLVLVFSSCFCAVFSYDAEDLGYERRSNSTGVLNVFQSYKPVTFLPQGTGCNQELLLMEHQFAFSDEKPFVGMLSLALRPNLSNKGFRELRATKV